MKRTASIILACVAVTLSSSSIAQVSPLEAKRQQAAAAQRAAQAAAAERAAAQRRAANLRKQAQADAADDAFIAGYEADENGDFLKAV